MNRTYTAQLFFAAAAFVSFASSLASAQLNVVVDNDNHFVLQSDGFDALGIQLESASGSLVPTDLSDTGPFDISLMKNPMVVMFGSLGRSVRVEGDLRLPTQWNPDGQRDVGFRWGSPTAEGAGSVVGHVAEFVTPRSKSNLETAEEITAPEVTDTDAADTDTTESVVPESVVPDSDITIGLVGSGFVAASILDEDLPVIQGGDVASDIPVIASANETVEIPVTTGGSTSSVPAFILPGYVGLDVAAEPLLVYLAWNPNFDTLTVSSTEALLAPAEVSTGGVTLVSQSESSATFAFDDLPDGGYDLPLSWLGNDPSDLSLSIAPMDDRTQSVILEVLGDAPSRLAPEPSGMTSLLTLCLALPFLRKRYR